MDETKLDSKFCTAKMCMQENVLYAVPYDTLFCRLSQGALLFGEGLILTWSLHPLPLKKNLLNRRALQYLWIDVFVSMYYILFGIISL